MQELANGAASRWKEIYLDEGQWRLEKDAKAIYNKLVALGETPDPDKVDSIIGSVAWTHRLCDACHEQVSDSISIEGWAKLNIIICRSCAELMVGLFADGDGEGS